MHCLALDPPTHSSFSTNRIALYNIAMADPEGGGGEGRLGYAPPPQKKKNQMSKIPFQEYAEMLLNECRFTTI